MNRFNQFGWSFPSICQQFPPSQTATQNNNSDANGNGGDGGGGSLIRPIATALGPQTIELQVCSSTA